jgi:hypothetical protein
MAAAHRWRRDRRGVPLPCAAREREASRSRAVAAVGGGVTAQADPGPADVASSAFEQGEAQADSGAADVTSLLQLSNKVRHRGRRRRSGVVRTK